MTGRGAGNERRGAFVFAIRESRMHPPRNNDQMDEHKE